MVSKDFANKINAEIFGGQNYTPPTSHEVNEILIKAMKAIVRRVVNFFISIYQLSYLYSYIF